MKSMYLALPSVLLVNQSSWRVGVGVGVWIGGGVEKEEIPTLTHPHADPTHSRDERVSTWLSSWFDLNVWTQCFHWMTGKAKISEMIGWERLTVEERNRQGRRQNDRMKFDWITHLDQHRQDAQFSSSSVLNGKITVESRSRRETIDRFPIEKNANPLNTKDPTKDFELRKVKETKMERPPIKTIGWGTK